MKINPLNSGVYRKSMKKFLLDIPKIFFPAVLGLFYSCSASEEKTTPQRENISESVYASGIIRSKNQYQVYANANGLIETIFLSEGDTVGVGDPILVLQNEAGTLNRELAELARDYADLEKNQTRLKDFKINIDLAKSRMDNDSLLWVRQKRLREKEIGSLLELEQRRLAHENSRTSYEALLLKYEDLKREIAYNESSATKNLAISRTLENEFLVRSKIKGRIYALLKEKGEMVTAQTPLAILGSADEFLLELQVDEFDIVKVEKGQRILVTMDSYQGKTFEAKVNKIHPLMDDSSKSFTVEAIFVENPPMLYPNLSLEVNIIIQYRENVLTLPRSYILEDRFVVTADGDTVEVVLGISDFQKAEIISGLDEDTQVIRTGG